MEYFCRRNQKFGLLLCSQQFLVIFFKDFRCLRYAAIGGTQYHFLLHRICSKTESKSKETECIVGVIDRPPPTMWDIPSEWSLSVHDQVGTTSCGIQGFWVLATVGRRTVPCKEGCKWTHKPGNSAFVGLNGSKLINLGRDSCATPDFASFNVS